MSEQNMSQSEIVRKNIAAVTEMQRRTSEARTVQGRAADAITDFSGSMAFVYLHALWFGVWILLNVGLVHVPHLSEFDPFPFGLLTLIVSLEAIFLSTFVLISQNRLARASERRAELDLQVNLLAEQKTAKVLDMLDQIAQQLDAIAPRFNFSQDPEVQALKVSTDPQEVLQVIEESVKEEAEAAHAEMREAIEDITGEVHVVRADVRHVTGKLQDVASDLQEIKQDLKGKDES